MKGVSVAEIAVAKTPEKEDNTGRTIGIIVGVIIGVVLLLIVGIYAIFTFMKRSARALTEGEDDAAPENAPFKPFNDRAWKYRSGDRKGA